MVITEKLIRQHLGCSGYLYTEIPLVETDSINIDINEFKLSVIKQQLPNHDSIHTWVGLQCFSPINNIEIRIPVFTIEYDSPHIPYDIKSTCDDSAFNIILEDDSIIVEIPSKNHRIAKVHRFELKDIAFANKYLFGVYWLEFLKQAGVNILYRRRQT